MFPASFAGGGPGFVFVVTDSAIVLVSLGAFGRTRPSSVWGTYPRGTPIGPVETGAGAFFEFAGCHFEIEDEYVPVVNAADAETSAGGGLPDDPFPAGGA